VKTRDIGMPDEELWASFFAPAQRLAMLGLNAKVGNAVDFGCGYGTFAVPAAKLVRGIVYALDIDPAMVAATRANAEAGGVRNLEATARDIIASGAGLPDAAVDCAMLFNILHCEDPLSLLREAHRVLVPSDTLAIMHWNYDASTPCGPSLHIRPRPEQCRAWAIEAGFEPRQATAIDLPPYHYGFTFRKPTAPQPRRRGSIPFSLMDRLWRMSLAAVFHAFASGAFIGMRVF
jgi:SAM-dependent methyltransferase